MTPQVKAALAAGATVYLCTDATGRDYMLIAFSDNPAEQGRLFRKIWST